jgi:hypothetical protein
MKKIISLMLSLVLAVTLLASCDNTNGPLPSDTYKAEVQIKYSSEHADMAAAISPMESKATIYRSGSDLKIETGAIMNNVTLSDNYVFFSGMLYHENRLTVDDKTVVTLERTSLTEDKLDQLLTDVGAGAGITSSDFNVQDKLGDELSYTEICSRITSRAKASLEEIFGAKLKTIGATVSLTDAKYTLVGENGRDTSSSLTCFFNVTLNGTTYDVTVEMVTTYDYDAVFGIGAPAFTSDYKQVGYDEMFK